MTTALAPPSVIHTKVDELRTLAELVDSLGGIPLQRIRLKPMPGTATETDLLSENCCELVDGVIVERGVGYFESRLGTVLLVLIENWLATNNIGYCNGEGALTRMRLGNVRVPDVSFVRWDRVGNQVPRDPICDVGPNLAVEILSHTNTKAEIDRKRTEYFDAGVELVWIVDPVKRIVEAWTTPRDCHLFGVADTLDGAGVLPGFAVSIKEWFERADRRPSQP